MKKILSLLLILGSFTVTFSQTLNQDINKIVSEHLKEFRQTIGQDATVIFVFDYDTKEASLTKNDYALQPYINPKKIKGEDNFFVKFLMVNSNGHIAVRAINFRIKKLSRKHIELVNMGNGNEYLL